MLNENDFNMPIDVVFNKEKSRLHPTNDWKKLKIKTKTLSNINVLTDNFYVKVVN